MPRYTEHPRPQHTFVHISDTHLVEDYKLYGRFDSAAHLATTMAHLEQSGIRPEAIILTGDIADEGSADAYRAARAVVHATAARIGADVVWLMGNHDNRAAFRTELLDGVGSTEPVDEVRWFGGLRLISLDSTVPGFHHGHVSKKQLEWLKAELAEPAPDGTILALHHPPLPTFTDLAVAVELLDQASLRDVVVGSDVAAILAGHLHYPANGMFGGVPVMVAASTAFTQDLTSDWRGEAQVDSGQSFNVVQVYRHTVVSTVVPVSPGRSLAKHDAAESARILADAGVVWRDAVPDLEH
ncbi:metallophosphoesterase [Leifsonia sp. Leaf264]|uniref:metallophosphoesterase n=1 Tax=Leifsonia sp. Leaf264 TaxID=1736314 RepID=UPI0006F34B7A|nr:metallophosphoesterase [Leifsonia sp. Leaf264]KQO98200.1 3',5'-cyclic-nucleotide phosphodiesterase [Leifsonia sp. Leaf264]